LPKEVLALFLAHSIQNNTHAAINVFLLLDKSYKAQALIDVFHALVTF